MRWHIFSVKKMAWLILLFAYHSLFAQNTYSPTRIAHIVDEVKKEKSESQKIFLMRDRLGNTLNTIGMEDRLRALAEIERLLLSPPSPLYQSEIKRLWAYEVYFFERDTNSINRVFKEIIAISKNQKKYEHVVDYYKDWGNMLARNQFRLYNESKAIYEEAYQYAKENHLHKKMIESIVGIGSFIYEPSGDINTAIGYYLIAQKLADSLKMPPIKQIDILHQIGISNYMIKNYEESKTIFRHLYRLMHDSSIVNRRRINLTNTIGLSFQHQSKYDSAIYFFNLASQDALYQKDTVWVGISQGNIGDTYMLQKQYKKALRFLHTDYIYSKRFNERNNFMNTAAHIAQCHKELGNYDSAAYYYESSLKEIEHSQEFNFKENRSYWTATTGVYQGLSRLYAQKKEYERAYFYAQKLLASNDSIAHYQQQEQVEEHISKALIAKKEIEFHRQEALDKVEIHRQSLISIGAGIFSILALVLTFVFYTQNKNKKVANARLASKNEEISKQKEEILQQAEELKVSNDKLTQLDRFKQIMTGTIVHDLKNPLNAMLHLVPAQENQTPRNTLKKVQNLSRLMLNLVMDILDVQKFEEAQMSFDTQEVSIKELIQPAHEQISFLLEEKNINLLTLIHEDVIIKVEKDFIIRVLVNLLTNAIKYSPQNSQIIIRTAQEKEFLKMSVADEGTGIPADKLDKVFDKFVQVDARQSGQIKSTGLGLTFCKMAIKAHKGDIGVNSIYQKGAEFWFTLPVIHWSEKLANLENYVKKYANLTAEDKIFLAPYSEQFRALEVYYSTALNTLLQDINFKQSETLQAWEKQMENAIFTMNEAVYEQLIREII